MSNLINKKISIREVYVTLIFLTFFHVKEICFKRFEMAVKVSVKKTWISGKNPSILKTQLFQSYGDHYFKTWYNIFRWCSYSLRNFKVRAISTVWEMNCQRVSLPGRLITDFNYLVKKKHLLFHTPCVKNSS